jgi:superfamily II DNA or RNA helicase
MDKIIVKKVNEVYNKIDCEPGIAMELAQEFTFEVPGAKFMPTVRNKVWDGKIRLLNPLTCLLYAGLNDYVEKFCQSRNYEYETEGLENDEEFSIHEAKKLIEKMAITKEPRDYQIDAYVHAVRKRRALLLSPTASGKSLIIYMLTRHYATNTLIIVPTTSLVHQMASDFVDYGLKGDIIHKIMGGIEKETNKPIVISTWQSLYKLPKTWFDKFNLVIGDESHLFKSKSLTTIMTNLSSCQHRFGFTGTLDGTQTNKMVLEGLFGPVRKVTTTSELMKKGTVAELKIKALVLKYSDDLRKEVSKMDYQGELDFIVTNQARNKFITI